MQKMSAAETSTRANAAPVKIVASRSAVPRAKTSCAPEPWALRIDRSSREFAEALAQWRRAAREAPPLLAPEWSLLTMRLLGGPESLIVGARRAGSLVLALPLARHGRTLRALRSDHTPRVDVVGDATALPELWSAMRGLDHWDALVLRGVPADSPLVTVVADLARADGYEVRVREITRAPWFEVEGIESRIHRRFRGDMRRLERQLGGVELERVGKFDRNALRDLFRLEAAGWKGAARTAIASDPGLVAFYTTAARVFAHRGQLTLAFLRSRGKRVAACFALEDRTTFHLLKIAYDPEFAHFGPGQLLVRETAADAARRGLVRYDLLGQESSYKMKWTDRVRPHVELVVYAASLRGRARFLANEIARPLAGRTLRALRSTQV